MLDRYAISAEADIADAVRKLEADRKQRKAAGSHVMVTFQPAAPAPVAKANLLN